MKQWVKELIYEIVKNVNRNIQPTFIIDYPKDEFINKRTRSEPELTERFELLVNGSEIANAYSELNDPIDN